MEYAFEFIKVNDVAGPFIIFVSNAAGHRQVFKSIKVEKQIFILYYALLNAESE